MAAAANIESGQYKEQEQFNNSQDKQFEEMLIGYIRDNDEKKFMDTLGPTR